MRRPPLSFFAALAICLAFFTVRSAFADVTQVVFVSSPQTIAVGSVSEQITLQAQDGSGTESKVASTACVSLSSSSSGEFSSSAVEWSSVTTLTIAKNTANRNFYYKGTAEGTHTLSAKVALKPDAESRSCANWPIEEWPSGWNATHSITVGNSSAAPQPPNTAGAGTDSQNESSVSAPPSSSESSAGTNISQIYVNATVPQKGTAGAPVFFDATAIGIKKEPLQNARYVWSFGDGGTAEGKKVSHTYHYPEAYVVMVTASSGEWSATDRSDITILTPELALSKIKEGSDGFIELHNAGPHEVDLSFWMLKSGTRTFTIPQGTVIGGKKTVPFPTAITGLSVDMRSAALLYPNGNIATAYTEPPVASVPSPKKPEEPKTTPVAVPETVRVPKQIPKPAESQPRENGADLVVERASSTELLGAAGAAEKPSAAPWALGAVLLTALSIGGYLLLNRTGSAKPTEAERLQKEAAEYEIVEEVSSK